MPLRRLVKHAAGSWGRLWPRPGNGSVSILTYHRVTGDIPVELDLPFELFERQLRWIAANVAVVAYRDAVDGLLAGDRSQPWSIALTFDDAYEDFYTRALPLLRELGLPAIVFVPTGFIDSPSQLPLSRDNALAVERMRPMSWDQLRELAQDPLVSLGSHTHHHPNLDRLEAEEIRDEMRKSLARFETELKQSPREFAYPRGAWSRKTVSAVRDFCDSAAIVGGALATPGKVQRYAIPRIPIRRSDGMQWFEPRVRGQMLLEERIMTAGRKIRRRGSAY